MKYIAALAALLLTGCTPSLEPLYTAQDNVFDPGLLGTWREVKVNADNADWLFVTRRGPNSYRVVHSVENGAAVFTGRLTQINGRRFIDLYPDKPTLANGYYSGHLWRTHSFGRLVLDANRLTVYLFDADWFETEAGRASGLERRVVGDEMLLTASTARLREIAAQFPDKNGPFSAECAWTREPGN